MSYIVYKTYGKQEYAYEATQVKNKETGKWQQKQKYLGVVIDKDNKIFEKRTEIKRMNQEIENQEKAILDYGDTYFCSEILENGPLLPILKDVFGKQFDTLISLILYRIGGGRAMRYAQNWYDGNAVKIKYPKAKITTQNISEFLKWLGDEKLQRAFFKKYLRVMCGEKAGLIIDSTGLPNEIHMPITDWGHHNGGIEKETRLILAVEKTTKAPLYFRYVSGNIPDVITLSNTINEIKQLGVTTNLSLMDAGYYSEDNIKELYKNKIDFLIRLPAGRKIYKKLVDEHRDIESTINIVKYNERGLFVKCIPINLYGNPGFAYVTCDPERRGREMSKTAWKSDSETTDDDFLNCGKMILVSSVRIDTTEIIPLYYTRQMAEQLFGISKDDLNILPIRTHNESTFRGFIMLIFLSLIVYLDIKSKLGNDVTIESALSVLRNLKCKVFDNNLIICERTKPQRLLLELLDNLVGKKSGV